MGFRPTAEELAELIEEIDEDGWVGTNHSAAFGHVPQLVLEKVPSEGS